MPAPVRTTTLRASSTQARTSDVLFVAMVNSSLRRVIAAAAPLWAGEAEVVATYFRSRERTPQTDLLWLKRQCFKEFWGSGVARFDRGGIVPGSLRRLAEQSENVDRSITRHEFLDALETVRAEFSHYTYFADLHDRLRPEGAPKLHPGMLEEWPEEKELTALRFRHREAYGAIGMRACKTSEGGYCTLFAEGMKLAGRPGVDGLIAQACSKVYEDEFAHMLSGIAGIAEDEGLSEPDWKLVERLLVEQLEQRIRMRNAQFSYPLSQARVQAIYRGDIEPIRFDYQRAGLAQGI